MLHTHPRKISRWASPFFFFFFFLFFLLLLVNLLFLCFIKNFMVGHCHFVVVCSWEIVWFGWKSLCGHVDFLSWGILKFLSCLVLWSLDNVDGLWSFALYVVCYIIRWILTWFFFLVDMKLWEFGVLALLSKPIFDEWGNLVGMCRHYFHGYRNFFCGYYFHERGFFVFLVLFSWVRKFCVCWTYVWVIVEWIYGDEGFLGWLGYC